MEKIKQLLNERGWNYNKDGEIKEVVKDNGDIWYIQGNKEFNGRHVIEIWMEDKKD